MPDISRPSDSGQLTWFAKGVASCLPVMIAVVAAAVAVFVCDSEVTTAMGSFCGTCRGSASLAVYEWGGGCVAVAVLAATIAQFTTRGEFRVARSAAAIALAYWMACVGFIRDWW